MAPSYILTVVLLPLPITLASPTPLHLTPLSARDNPHPTWGCPFPGNSDLYGIGIRLGVYLQLLSTILSNTISKPSIRKDAQNTNAIIMIAVFAAMVTSTIQGNLNSVEIFIMSTVLAAFLWSDFTPLHISSIVLFEPAEKGLAREGRGGKEKSYAAAISRSIFGTAKAVFDVWYWLYGRHKLIKNGIDDPTGKCQPTIFLHTQILLNGYQPTFYIVIAFMYGIFEVVFMAWWLFILLPGTVKLLYDIGTTIGLAFVKLEFGRLRRLRSIFALWYLGFARLDKSRLTMWDRVRMSNDTRERLRKWATLLTWFGPFGLPAGYTVIVWSALAIEMTLAWNRVTGVYVLGSTGQLIPFVVGVLGMIRNLHLIILQVSKRISHKKEKQIEVDWEDGRFLYATKSGVELQLKASRPERRRSIDCPSLFSLEPSNPLVDRVSSWRGLSSRSETQV